MSLTAEGLVFERDGRRVLDGVSFAAAPGDFLAIAGRNGAGKSTLLRILSGELHPASGSIRLGGNDLSRRSVRELARLRSMLSQNPACDSAFTVAQTVRLGAEAAGHRMSHARDATERALEAAGLAGFSRRRMGELSGGERQRVHWARILAQINGRPEGHVVFMDEPVAGLDLQHQHDLIVRARGLAAAGACVVAVLHDLQLVHSAASRVVLLSGGRIAAEGPPASALTPALIATVFGIECRIVDCPGFAPAFAYATRPPEQRR